MRTTFIALGIALLITVLVWASIIFFDPGMNIDKAYSIIVLSFIGSAVFTAVVLSLQGRSRKPKNSPST